MEENFDHCLDELLARPLRASFSDRVRGEIVGKVVLATGAGGSIGSALANGFSTFTSQNNSDNTTSQRPVFS